MIYMTNTADFPSATKLLIKPKKNIYDGTKLSEKPGMVFQLSTDVSPCGG
jgi:hypothetical protein